MAPYVDYLEKSLLVKNGKHVPLTRPSLIGCFVFRGKPHGGSDQCMGFVRTRKSRCFRSYIYTLSPGGHTVKSVEECNQILEQLESHEKSIREGLQSSIQYQRKLQKMLKEIDDIPVKDSMALTWNQYKSLRSKQRKAESIFYGILARLDRGGRRCKNDGERMHKASADMEKYEKEADMISRCRSNEYFFVERDGFYRNGFGVCHYIFTPSEDGCFGNAETIQLGTKNKVTRMRCAYYPSLDYKKEEKGEEQEFCYIRTKGDLEYVRKKLPAWLNQNFGWIRKDLKKAREDLLQIKCMIHETKLERLYLNSPKLQKKEQEIIEKINKEIEEKAAQEYAMRPRFDTLNVVKLWDGEIHWQCGKCLEKNVSHNEANHFEEECRHCWEINEINLGVPK